jgi:hypothetical protein
MPGTRSSGKTRNHTRLKDKGMSKERAARIANSQGASQRAVQNPLRGLAPSKVGQPLKNGRLGA